MGSNKGITQIINKTFANHFATEVSRNPLTLIIGKFSGEQNEDVSSDVAKDSLAGAVVGKTMSENVSENISLVTKRINWKKGAIFIPYDPNKSSNDNHYCLVDDNGVFSVYMCVSNGKGYDSGLISTIKPAGNFGTIIKSEDGYEWLKLYTISGSLSQFLTAKFMPVPTFTEIKNAPTNSILRLAQKTVDYWYSKRNSILRIDIDSSIKDIRWISKPEISLRQIPETTAKLNIIFSNDTTNTIRTRRGFKLERIDVLGGGKGYGNVVNAFSLSAEPDYSELNITSDHIVGNSYNSSLKKYGPLIKPVLYAGYLDYASVLNADRTMVNFFIDSAEIQQTTSVTSFDSVAIVQNLKTNTDTKVNIESKVGKNKPFRMSDVIQTSSSNSFVVGNEVQSTLVSGSNNTRGTGAKVAAKPTSTSIEVTRHDGNIIKADTVWSPSLINNTTLTTSKSNDKLGLSVGSAAAAKNTVNGKYLGGSVAAGSVSTVTTVDKGEGKLAQDSLVLYSNNLGATDTITQSEGIRVRFIIGGSDVSTV